jgi:hypothetical protein
MMLRLKLNRLGQGSGLTLEFKMHSTAEISTVIFCHKKGQYYLASVVTTTILLPI